MENVDIIAATDLSARSDRAVDRAMQLSTSMGLTLGICHAIKPGSYMAGDREMAEGVVRAALPDPDAKVEILLPVGSPPRALAEAAELSGAKLIVTGVARFNCLGDYFIGHAIEYLIERADCPVLVVKQRAHKPYRRILVATDFSSCSLHALKQAAELFPDAELHIFHAWHVAYGGWKHSEHIVAGTVEDAEHRMAQFLDEADLAPGLRDRLTVHLERGDFGGATLTMLAELDPDLFVLGTHGQSGFIKAIAGRTAMAALEWIDCDALVAREPT